MFLDFTFHSCYLVFKCTLLEHTALGNHNQTGKAFPFSSFHWEMLRKPFASWFMWKGPSLFFFCFSFLKDSYLEGLPFWRVVKLNCKNRFWFLHKFSQFTVISTSSGCLPGILKHFKNACNYADTVPHVAAIISLWKFLNADRSINL